MKRIRFLKYIVPLILGFSLAQGVQANSFLPGGSGDPIVSKTYLEQAVSERLGPLEAELDSLNLELGTISLPFTDISGSDIWAKNQIIYLYNKQVIAGRPDKTFKPKDNITRAEFAKIVVLATGNTPITAQASRFPDVPKPSGQVWQIGYIEAAAEHNLIVGDTKGYFNPDKWITREEMAAILVRALGLEAAAQTRINEQVPFADSNLTSTWAKGYVIVAKEQGLINGRPKANGQFEFAPKEFAQRQEAAQIIYEFIN